MSIRSLLLVLAVWGCTNPPPSQDRGPIEDILTLDERVAWPGLEEANGRVLLSLRGFAEGQQIGYWFFGFGAKRTADSFWFCREGDDACPLDEHRRLNWDRLVGHPIFTRIPGDREFSPFWMMWVVRVPEDFEPDSVKTVESLDALARGGDLEAGRFVLDFGEIFGERVGPREVLLHCAMTLAGSELSLRDISILDDPTKRILDVPRKFGWFKGHRVEFFDFSVSEGVFPAAAESDNRPQMRIANVYILWRDCSAEPRPALCDIPSVATPTKRAVSERGIGQDMTGDHDTFDTNNVFASSPCSRQRPSEFPYSPLWGPSSVFVDPARQLVDSYGVQGVSDVKSANDVFDVVGQQGATMPALMMEDETGNPVPGNDGRIFFDCPFAVEEGFVPYPCEDNP